MQICGIRNRGKGHEYALNLALFGIKVLSPLKLLKIFYILKQYLVKARIIYVPCCLATEE